MIRLAEGATECRHCLHVRHCAECPYCLRWLKSRMEVLQTTVFGFFFSFHPGVFASLEAGSRQKPPCHGQHSAAEVQTEKAVDEGKTEDSCDRVRQVWYWQRPKTERPAEEVEAAYCTKPGAIVSRSLLYFLCCMGDGSSANLVNLW